MTARSQFVLLVVQDETVLTTELISQLREFEYRVLGPVSSAENALHLAEQDLPDLLLTDIHLQSGEDGVALAATLRARYGIPAFYLSTDGDRATVERALATEPFGFLTAPVREPDLRASLKAALRRAQLEKELQQRGRELALANAVVEHALAATRESEARFRAVFEGSPDAILVVAPNGTILMANAAASALFSDVRDELIGSELERLLAPSLRDVHRKLRASFFASPRARMMNRGATVYTRDRQGHEVPLEVALNTLEIGGQVCAMVIARNVSQRRQHEAQIARLQKLDALGRLAAGVAHDFNNIVGVILTLSATLEQKLANQPSTCALAQDLREAGQRAASLTGQLLTFARCSPAAAQCVDLNHEVRGFVRLLRRTLQPLWTIELDLDTEACRATLDPTHLQQVLLNLVVNARDAMPEGGAVRIQTRNRQSSPSGLVGPYLEVEDTGHGMTDDVKNRLFEPLFTTKAAGEGTGLGLSTVYGIVTQAGGEIVAESELDRGSRFCIWLPAPAPNDAPPPLPQD